jgi:hypothetical protein
MSERISRQPRPSFLTRDQLDELCEKIIVSFCMERYGQELTPIPTEALLELLDQHAQRIDQLAELPEGIQGVTLYYWDRKPDGKIDSRLTREHWRETGGEQRSRTNARTRFSTRRYGMN